MNYTLLSILFFFSSSLLAQEKALKISLQTDLIAYTTSGGWSAWLAVQHHENKLSFAYVNFPNRYADYYEESGLKENDRFFRLQYARYFKPESRFENVYVGLNMEYHLRELEEDNNTEILEDTGFKIAPIIGYEWHPWCQNNNALGNLSLAVWAGPTFLMSYDEKFIFQETASAYQAPESIEVSVGVLLSYTIYKNY